MKKILCVFIAIFIMANTFTIAHANDYNVVFNGKDTEFNSYVVEDKELFVDSNELSELLDLQSHISDSNIELSNKAVSLVMNAKSDKALVNNKIVTIKNKAIKNGQKLLLPASFIVESFGGNLQVNSTKKQVNINYSDNDSFVFYSLNEAFIILYNDSIILISDNLTATSKEVVEFLSNIKAKEIELLVSTSYNNEIKSIESIAQSFEVKNLLITDSKIVKYHSEILNDINTQSLESTYLKKLFDKAILNINKHNENGKNTLSFVLESKDVNAVLINNENLNYDFLKNNDSDFGFIASLFKDDFLAKNLVSQATYSLFIYDKLNNDNYFGCDTAITIKDSNNNVFKFLTKKDSIENINKYGSVSITNIDCDKEIVTIKNLSKEDVNLNDWTLVSETGNQQYTFPNIVLKAGSTIYITSGKNAKSDDKTYFKWTKSYIWNNNDYDPGYLYDTSNNLVSSYGTR